jgi:hypothetical protein
MSKSANLSRNPKWHRERPRCERVPFPQVGPFHADPTGGNGLDTGINPMSDEDELRENEAEEQDRRARAIKRQIDEIRPAYAQALTSLWLGNAGASLAVLSFIGASWRMAGFDISCCSR